MKRKNFLIINSIIFFLLIVTIFYFKYFKKPDFDKTKIISSQDTLYSANIIKNVNYTSRDTRGNEYIINAIEGEIDLANSNIIYLTNVNALIKLNNSKNVTVTSDFGKYNINNYDTIFSKNVIINYLDNNIIGEYLDFSIERNSMIVSRNVIYTNRDNILKADVAEIDIKTKYTKIFIYENNKKVNIKSKR